MPRDVLTRTSPRPHLPRASGSYDGRALMAVAHAEAGATRRARLLAGLQPWADARPQYRLRLGPAALAFSALSDEALLALRSRVAADVRRERALRQRAAA